MQRDREDSDNKERTRFKLSMDHVELREGSFHLKIACSFVPCCRHKKMEHTWRNEKFVPFGSDPHKADFILQLRQSQSEHD